MTDAQYSVSAMVTSTEKAFSALLQRAVHFDLALLVVKIGRRLFDEEGDFLERMRQDILRASASLVRDIVRCDITFEVWRENAEYQQRTLLKMDQMRPTSF